MSQTRIKAGKKQVPADFPIVAVLVPSYDTPHPRCYDGLLEMMRYTTEQKAAVVFRPNIIFSSVVHWTRNQLIAQFIKTGEPFTHVLFVDDDIEVPKDCLVKMLSHKKDIVSAICTRRTSPPIPNVRMWSEELGSYTELWQWKEGLIEVDAIGTGVMLISLEALQKIADAYFQCRYERDVLGMPDAVAKKISEERVKLFDTTGDAWWFRFLPPPSGAGECGEDVSFCMVAKKYAGLSIYADTTIVPLHWGDYGYSLKDFIPGRDKAIEKAKAEGKLVPHEKEPEIVVVD